MKRFLIAFINPVTGLESQVGRCSRLGRAALAAQDGRACTALALRQVCEALDRELAIRRLTHDRQAQRVVLVRTAERAGRFLSWAEGHAGECFPSAERIGFDRAPEV